MKQLSRIASAVALAAGLFGSGSVMATEICNNCYYRSTDATYLGVHNANTFDSSGFRRDEFSVAVVTPIVDTWIFDLQPASGFADISASFRPVGLAFTNFQINIFSATAVCNNGQSNSTQASTAGACDSFALVGGAIATSTNIGSAAQIPFATLAAGRYAFQISGMAQPLQAGQTANYSGQIGFQRVPEPASLALVGLALMGAAVATRRSQKA